MSTRSTIKIVRKDGTEKAIYCHFDGYIEGVGVTLQLAYNTAEKVEKLLELGDLSTLGYYTEPDPAREHSFDGERQENVCVAYHRDRGEAFRQSNSKQEYNYTFNEEQAVWYVSEEKFNRDSEAQKYLHLDYCITYEESLLLDAIMKSDIDFHWQDDEFAKAGYVKEACKAKAYEAREEIIHKLIEEEQAYYRAYCD